MSTLALDAQALYLDLLAGVRALWRPEMHMAGVTSGGVWLAQRLGQDLGLSGRPGILSSALHRDDYAQRAKTLLMSMIETAALGPADGRTVALEREGVMRIIEFMKERKDGFASLEEVSAFVASYLPHRETPKKGSGGGLGIEKNLRRREDGRYVWHWDPRVLDAYVGGAHV